MILLLNSAGIHQELGRDSLEQHQTLLPYGPAILVNTLKQSGFPSVFKDLRNLVSPTLSRQVEPTDFEKYFLDGEVSPLLQEFFDKAFAVIPEIEKVTLIAISVFCYLNYPYALVLAREIKNRYPKVKIILGGAFISVKNLEIPHYVDFYVKGCGAKPLIHLAEHIINQSPFKKDFPGIAFQENGRWICNSTNHEPAEDELLPDYSNLNLEAYTVENVKVLSKEAGKVLIVPYRTSKGCANNCSFCSGRFDSKLSFKSTEKVIRELMALKAMAANVFIRFTDASINNHPQKINEILDKMVEANLNLPWWGYVKVNGVNQEFLEKAAKSRCKILCWGVEHFSQHMLEIFNKRYKVEDAIQYIALAAKNGIECQVAVILNGPSETRADLKILEKNIRRFLKFPNVIFRIYSFLLEEGTGIYNNPEKYNIEILADTWTFYNMSGRQIEWKEKGLSIEAFKQKQNYHFKKYIELKNLVSANSRLRSMGIRLPVRFVSFLSILNYTLKHRLRSDSPHI